jgi:superfamily II DNA or RNA helicase
MKNLELQPLKKLQTLKNETDPLDYGEIKPVEQLLRSTERLDSYTEDIEKMQFFINKNIKDWWSGAFVDEERTVAAAKNEGKKGEIQKLKLMQQYVAYKIKTNRRFGNFSGTGAGKTLSAIVSSRVVDSKMTIIICPYAVIEQWEDSIKKTFPDSVVIPSMAAFYEKYEENKYKYLVINYDLFSQPLSSNWVLELAEQKIDFIVLDEIHFTKRRDEKQSNRRTNIEGLLTKPRMHMSLGCQPHQ